MEKYYTVNEVAEKVNLSAKTLIRWEKNGKLKPAKRDFKGWRAYTEEDVQNILDIRYAIQQGVR